MDGLRYYLSDYFFRSRGADPFENNFICDENNDHYTELQGKYFGILAAEKATEGNRPGSSCGDRCI